MVCEGLKCGAHKMLYPTPVFAFTNNVPLTHPVHQSNTKKLPRLSNNAPRGADKAETQFSELDAFVSF